MKVSVVMPVYNVEKFVAQAIRSVLAQSHQDFELIIVDDCSPDGSMDICRRFLDPRIRLLSHRRNRGLAGARNTGVRHARGDLVAFLDSDDLWHPDKLRQHVDHLRDNPQVGLSFSRSEFINEAGVSLGCYQMPRLKDISPACLLARNPVGNGSAPVLRREVLDAIAFAADFEGEPEIRYFDSSLRQSEDIECWLRIALTTQWQIEGIPAPLTCYRLNSGGLSASIFKQLQSWERMLENTRRYAPGFIAAHARLARAYQLRYLARQAIRLHDGVTAIRLSRAALACDWRIMQHEPVRSLLTLLASALLRLSPHLYQRIEHKATGCIGRLQKRRITADQATA